MTNHRDPLHDLVRLASDLTGRPFARRRVGTRKSIRIVVVDDHALVRESLRVLLQSAPDIVVAAEADNKAAGILEVERHRPDIVVLDLDMPDADGTAALRDITGRLPSARVLVLTMHAEHQRLLALLEAGARGLLTKEAASRELIEAIRVVASGEIYVQPTVARLLVAALVLRRSATKARDKFDGLSEREQSVLRLVAQGFNGAEISRHLAISNKTVDTYKQRIEDKLGLGHRTEYVRFAVAAGILGP